MAVENPGGDITRIGTWDGNGFSFTSGPLAGVSVSADYLRFLAERQKAVETGLDSGTTRRQTTEKLRPPVLPSSRQG